jgi:hypothetical protein
MMFVTVLAGLAVPVAVLELAAAQVLTYGV